MTRLRIEPVDRDAALDDWRHVHNTVIPTAPLSVEEVRERIRRNRLDVGYLDGIVVGCTTVRPPAEDPTTATVIARVLPEHRGRGLGTALYAHGLARAREFGVTAVETIVLASNVEGLRFALRHGFAEVDRYLLPGDTVPFVTLRRPLD
jgi:GNAT superfamily N-acetyltransferase